MDAKGNAFAVWSGGANRRAPGRSWPSPVALEMAAPVIHVAASGIATAVGTNATGILVQDTSPSGVWSPPRLVVPASAGSLVTFVANARGDAMIVFAAKAIRRAAGSSIWSPPETIAAVPAGRGGLTIESAAIGDAGDAVVTYETYRTVCGPRSCRSTSFTLNAARQVVSGAGFTSSGAITVLRLPLDGPHQNRIAVDRHGVAAVVYQEADPSNSGAVLLRVTEQARGQSGWTARATISAPSYQPPQPLAISVDQNSGASVVMFDGARNSYQAADGYLVSNVWKAPVTLTATHPKALPGGVTGSNSVGGLVLGWSSADGTIHAILRPAAGAIWGAAQTVASVDRGCSSVAPCTTINSAAMNNAGNAMVTWSNFDVQNEAFAFDAGVTN